MNMKLTFTYFLSVSDYLLYNDDEPSLEGAPTNFCLGPQKTLESPLNITTQTDVRSVFLSVTLLHMML